MSQDSSEQERLAAPISLGRYGEALALLAEYPAADRAVILTRLQMSDAEIAAGGAFWGRAIQDELAKGSARSAIELARAYGAAERYARQEHPPVARLKSQVRAVPQERARVVQARLAPLADAAPPSPVIETQRPKDSGVPTYLRADVQPAADARPADDPDTTQVPMAALPATLPFQGSLSREALDELLSRPASSKGAETAAPDVGETAVLPQLTLVAATSGTFRDKLGAVAVPTLTVDEYAELRARLTVFGSSHAETLERFGVTTPEAQEALRAAFNERFQRDADLQQRFLSSMQAAIAKARIQRGQP